MLLWMPYDRLYSKFQLNRAETPAGGSAGVAGNRPDCNRSIVVVAAPHVAAQFVMQRLDAPVWDGLGFRV